MKFHVWHSEKSMVGRTEPRHRYRLSDGFVVEASHFTESEGFCDQWGDAKYLGLGVKVKLTTPLGAKK